MINNNIIVIPAIDLIDGCAVRLSQGDYGRKTTYSKDPAEWARRFADHGATWLHLVDLDGAKASQPVNLKVLETLASIPGLSIEWGGGIKTEEALHQVSDAGASRIICGSVAAKSPALFAEWLEIFGSDKIVLGADVNNGFVAVSGWLESSPFTVEDLITEFIPSGLSQVICTDISKDGMLTGPSWEIYKNLSKAFPEISFTVSGGVASEEDIANAHLLGLGRIIVGKALYEGKITLEQLEKWWRKE